ncbi:MAG TPA: DUF192 domain-containing protein [Candidatus Dojkabacteria bacterium]|nr:DUF192 domain-containing protein [Candidatus Dojkabacteria bacterium]HQF37133.1 DUF192 domain-containing protein [Candidatus Dojkabacteria bacterium]
MKVKVKIPSWIKDYWRDVKKSFSVLGSTGSIIVFGFILTLILSVFIVSFISAKDQKEFEDIQNQIKMQKQYQDVINNYNLDMDANAMVTKDATIINNSGSIKGSFSLEVADNDVTRTSGLSGRDSIGENQGMLFTFTENTTGGFHMKDVKFPLDILFLDSENKVFSIFNSVPICETEECPIYAPDGSYYSVLELPGGTVEKFGIVEGDLLQIQE